MEQVSRRTLCKQTLGSVLTFSLLESLFQADAFGREVKPLITRWVADLDALGRDVKDQKVPQIIWQHKVEELFAQVDLSELLRLVWQKGRTPLQQLGLNDERGVQLFRAWERLEGSTPDYLRAVFRPFEVNAILQGL